MTLSNLWNDLSSLVALPGRRDNLEYALRFVGEEPVRLIPGVILGADGPLLGSIFAVTNNYLVEVDFKTAFTDISFDFIDRSLLTNYRVDLHTSILPRDEGDSRSFQAARVRLIHQLAASTVSNLTYVGPARSEWIDLVAKSFPPTLVLQGRALQES